MVVRRIRTRVIGGLGAAMLAIPLGLAAPPAYAVSGACGSRTVSDFNGDGISDAVVADPYATVAGRAQAGRVIVLYGDRDGRVGEGSRRVLSQDTFGVGGTAEAGDRFGSAISTADLGCDGFTDLVVGTPREDVGSRADLGLAQIIWGSAAGLGAGEPSEEITHGDWGFGITAGDQFGYAVDALENVGQGGSGDEGYAVAVGAPGGNIGGRNDAGWVAVLYAYDGGMSAGTISQESPGVPGSAEAGDRLGTAVSIGYLPPSASPDPDDDVIDVVVGVPGEDIGSVVDAGAITVAMNVYSELGWPGSLYLHQDSPGVPGSAEAGDRFGQSVDTVRVGTTSRLAVGVPGEDLGRARDAGAVQLFSSSTPTLTAGALLTQDTPGVAGAAESGDLFGSQLAFAAPGLGDRVTRLAVGAPSEDAAAVNQGIVQVFPVTDLDAEATYAQDSPGVPGAVAAGDEFGETLAFVSGFSERALLVGVPDDVGNRAGMVTVIPLGGGAPRAWVPGVGGIPLSGASRFGGALASVHGGTD